MEPEEALDRMREIQRIMERTALYTLLPGTPALVGGLLVWGAAAGSFAMLRSWDLAAIAALSPSGRLGFVALWATIAVAGIGLDVAYSLRALGKEGMPLRTRPIRFAAGALTLCLVAALAFTARIFLDGRYEYLAPVWLLCYGIGVYAAGLFSVRLPRLLGLAFVVTGVVALLVFPHHGLLLTTVAFGGYHVVFGLIVLDRTRRSRAQ
jgi:hypothetical protein